MEVIKKRILEETLEKEDDNEEIAIKRFETYENNIKPVINFYEQSNYLKWLMVRHQLLKLIWN